MKYAGRLHASWRPHQLWQDQDSELIFDKENAELRREPLSAIYYLPFVHKEGYREPVRPPPVVGLLLVKVPGVKGCYRRCGLFREFRGVSPDILKDAERIPLLSKEYHQRYGSGSYSTSII